MQITCSISPLALVLLASVSATAADAVQSIGSDWAPQRRIAYRVIATRCSEAFGGDNGPYASSKTVDGDRGTKWVAAAEPSEKAPQWLELDLDGTREVAAFAVFGGRPDNDGILAARVQVAAWQEGTRTWVDAERIDRASSSAWLVAFAPVKTDRVRLLITGSGGPSPHTDVYEVVVLSREMTSDERRDFLAADLARSLVDLQRVKARADALAGGDGSRTDAVRRRAKALQKTASGVLEGLHKWHDLGEATRKHLLDQVGAMDSAVRVLATVIDRPDRIWTDRETDLRKAAQFAATGNDGAIDVTMEGDVHRAASRHLVLDVDQRTGRWNVTWRGVELAGMRNVGFEIRADGRNFTMAGAPVKAKPFVDKLGSGTELVQRVGNDVQIERTLRVYRDHPLLVVAGHILNSRNRDIVLDRADLVRLGETEGGWWQVGSSLESPGAVMVQGSSDLINELPGIEVGNDRTYSSCGMIALAFPDSQGSLLVGFLSAREARPDVDAAFQSGRGGLELSARLPFLNRKLRAGESLELDSVCTMVEKEPYAALERYGDAVAATAAARPRTKPTALWCSWYAHRLSMTEDLVLANAAVAARHFKPLGLEFIQLDHGWQKGDVDGDWVVNEKFSHGLKWLADELRTRYGLKLGAWIAPVDLAETSDTFKSHPDWALMDSQGQPQTSGRWFWEPKPMCYVLDATQPDAQRFIERTFAQLTAQGVRYYKIDFIAVCGGQGFRQHDPYVTRGWGVLQKAMEAIRVGAGPDAWIRYCQTPPWLSVGLADGTVGGADTSDAGVPTVIDVVRTNARSMAAGYWLNDRLYHREVCDMSVGMRGPLWEARMKLAMMAIGGTSVSFSDELTYLPPSRIRMMQQCLPAGGPAMRPLDLFERSIPSLWHVHCKTRVDEWDVVGVFNFEDEPQDFRIDLDRLGIGKADKAAVFEFWNERFLGVKQGQFDVHLTPRETQIIVIRKVIPRPFLVGTDMHALAGYHELVEMRWDEQATTLSGRYRRAPGMQGRAYFYVAPDAYEPRGSFPLSEQAAKLTNLGNGLWMQEIPFVGPEVSWSIPFSRSATAPSKREPTDF